MGRLIKNEGKIKQGLKIHCLQIINTFILKCGKMDLDKTKEVFVCWIMKTKISMRPTAL